MELRFYFGRKQGDRIWNHNSCAEPGILRLLKTCLVCTSILSMSRSRCLKAELAVKLITNLVPYIDVQTSADRLLALESTCMTWGGALVIAMHVRLQSEIASVYEKVKQMHARVEDKSGCRLDIQLVTEDGFETEEDALQALYPVCLKPLVFPHSSLLVHGLSNSNHPL